MSSNRTLSLTQGLFSQPMSDKIEAALKAASVEERFFLTNLLNKVFIESASLDHNKLVPFITANLQLLQKKKWLPEKPDFFIKSPFVFAILILLSNRNLNKNLVRFISFLTSQTQKPPCEALEEMKACLEKRKHAAESELEPYASGTLAVLESIILPLLQSSAPTPHA